jgi:fructokinase
MFAAHTHCVSTRAAFGATPRHGSTSLTHSRVLGFAKPNRRGPATKGRNAAYPSITASASSNDDARITVIGEALWDSLPKGLFLGGAPANVACHLRELGRSPTVVSRVGDDELGREVLRRLTKRGLSTDLIQVDTTNTPTGFVVVTMDGSMPSYDIVQPSAWDAMEPTEQLVTAATGAVVVYGSLAQRDARSRAAIGAAAAVASKRVFDINLRPPFIDPAMCVEHAKQCWLLKLNDDELPEMYNWCGLDGLDGSDPAQVIAMACAVRDALECDNLCVTRGGDGALLVASSGAVAQHPGFDVTAVDTVGAGDSFLATLLDSLLGGATASASLERACRVGAFVATQQGATPMHDRDAIEGLVSK